MNRDELVEVVTKGLTKEDFDNKEVQREIINIGRCYKQIGELYEIVKKGIKNYMETEQLDRIDQDCISVKYVAPVIKDDVDTKQIVIDHPEYKQMYPKKTFVNGYVTIKIK